MNEDILIQAGLTKIEAKVYLSLLNLHSAQAGEISQKSGVHRRSVYTIIDKLLKKKLIKVVSVKGNKYFEAENPSNLFNLVQEKRKKLSSVLPSLRAAYEESKDTQVVNFFKGPEGLKTILDDVIIKGKEVWVIGAIYVPDEFKDIFRRYRERRVKHKIRSKLIFTEDLRPLVKNIDLDEVRFLPERYKNVSTTIVYANKVGIILFTKQPVAISIKRDEITKTYKDYFKLLWDMAKE